MYFYPISRSEVAIYLQPVILTNWETNRPDEPVGKEKFKADFQKYYGTFGDYILAWRVAGSDEEHIERPEMMVGRAKSALEFFFHDDIAAVRR